MLWIPLTFTVGNILFEVVFLNCEVESVFRVANILQLVVSVILIAFASLFHTLFSFFKKRPFVYLDYEVEAKLMGPSYD